MIPLFLVMGRSPRYLTRESSKIALFPNNTLKKDGKNLFPNGNFLKRAGLCVTLQVLE